MTEPSSPPYWGPAQGGEPTAEALLEATLRQAVNSPLPLSSDGKPLAGFGEEQVQ